MFLESFVLPEIETEERLMAMRAAENGGGLPYLDNPYPCRLFSSKDLYDLYFSDITVFYGGNGSGKSTLLNLIAEKLKLVRMAPFNTGEMVASYVEECGFSLGWNEEGDEASVPEGSRIITSDDIFDYMLSARMNNEEISENTDKVKQEWSELRYGRNVRFNSMEDYEDLKLQQQARIKSQSRRKYVRKMLGQEIKLTSNGETALRYFEEVLKPDKLYLLDEPENSMSPMFQLKLKEMLEEYSRFLGCQFIIATHSPFILSLAGARVFDLDARPVKVRNWWELENVRTYYQFFKDNEKHFQ